MRPLDSHQQRLDNHRLTPPLLAFKVPTQPRVLLVVAPHAPTHVTPAPTHRNGGWGRLFAVRGSWGRTMDSRWLVYSATAQALCTHTFHTTHRRQNLMRQKMSELRPPTKHGITGHENSVSSRDRRAAQLRLLRVNTSLELPALMELLNLGMVFQHRATRG